MILGITGYIGSGKSYVSNLFRKNNIPVYDTDSKAKEILNTNHQLKQELIDLLGNSIYKDGELNKKQLAFYLFSDQGYTDKINVTIHPYVTEDFKKWSKKELVTHKIVAVESAILVDSELVNCVDKIVFVEAPVELCIERATKRDNTNKIDIINRINKQPSHSDIVKFSNYVICNDGKKDNDIEMQVKNIIDNIF